MRLLLCGILLSGIIQFIGAEESDGGGSSGVAESLFINSMSVANSQTPGKASWKATCRFNSDRRSPNRFDPVHNSQDDFTATIGTHRLFAMSQCFSKNGNTYSFKSPNGLVPVISVTVDMSAEKIQFSMTKDTFEAPLANQTVPVTISLGPRQFSVTVALDSKGNLIVTPGYRSVSFVGTTGKAELSGSGHDVWDMNALLADPNFHFTPNVGGPFPLVIRLFNGVDLIAVVNIDQGVFSTTEKDGKIYYKIASASALKKTKFFQYDSKSGKMAMTLGDLNLSSLVDAEEQLGVEVTIDGQVYFTQQTIFRKNSASFQYAIP